MRYKHSLVGDIIIINHDRTQCNENDEASTRLAARQMRDEAKFGSSRLGKVDPFLASSRLGKVDPFLASSRLAKSVLASSRLAFLRDEKFS